MNKFHSTFAWTVCIARDLKNPETKHELDVQDFKYGEIVFPTQVQSPPLSFPRAVRDSLASTVQCLLSVKAIHYHLPLFSERRPCVTKHTWRLFITMRKIMPCVCRLNTGMKCIFSFSKNNGLHSCEK